MVGHSPPPFFKRGPAPLAKLVFFVIVSLALLISDLNLRYLDAFRQGQLSTDPQARAPYLNGEGQRVQPEWLFAFLREPGKNGIRPWLHPEWAYGNDVPKDKQALRMPTFNFTPEQVTARLADLERASALFSEDCLARWSFGVPSQGLGAMARVDVDVRRDDAARRVALVDQALGGLHPGRLEEVERRPAGLGSEPPQHGAGAHVELP